MPQADPEPVSQHPSVAGVAAIGAALAGGTPKPAQTCAKTSAPRSSKAFRRFDLERFGVIAAGIANVTARTEVGSFYISARRKRIRPRHISFFFPRDPRAI